MSRRWALGIAYLGSSYCGWQWQYGQPSIQAEVEKALSNIADSKVQTICAGRTDAGVHAFCQVVHFETDCIRSREAWIHGTNTCLPDQISVLWAEPVDDRFHARFSARWRRYRYIIRRESPRCGLWTNRVWHCYYSLDIKAMVMAADFLPGERDFSAFRSAGCQSRSPKRCLDSIRIYDYSPWLVIDVQANAFLHNMVRIIVGCLLDVGKGKHEPGWIKSVLDSKDRRLGGVTAPAQGLYFTGAFYPNYPAIPCLLPSGSEFNGFPFY